MTSSSFFLLENHMALLRLTTFAFLIFVAASGAVADDLELGKKLEGKLLEPMKTVYELGGFGQPGFTREVFVNLKAAQNISFNATVVGKDRKVWVLLFDPTGALIKKNYSYGTKELETTFEEVNADGKYKVLVVSDQIGPFTLRASDPADKEARLKYLDERLQQLKKELAATESELKSLRSK
jgi:hypothetical protein